MVRLLFIFILSCLMMLSQAQVQMNKTPPELILALQKTQPDTNRIKLLFQLSDFYLTNSVENKTTNDSSFHYLQRAVKLADTIHTANWRHQAFRHLGHYYFTTGDSKQGKESFLKIIHELNVTGNKKAEIGVWEELFNLIHSRDTSGLTRLTCLNKILLLYQLLNDKEKEIETLKSIADVHMNYGQLDTAEAELLNVLKMYKAINYRNLHYTYDLLAVTNRYKGDFNKAISYALKTVESMEATQDSTSAVTFYSRLANMYRELDQPQNSVKWYWKVFKNRKNEGPVNLYMFRDAGFLARELIKLSRSQEALEFILDIASKNKPIGIYAKASLVASLAYCYNALHKDDLANKHYLNLISLTNGLEKNNEVTADVNYEAGQYFFEHGQFAKASFHLQKALDVSPGINTPSVIKDIRLKLYSVDSAQGNYVSAINHLREYQKIKDSIFNETKSRQIEELLVQYETSQKEKNIQLLNNQNQLVQMDARQANRTKNITMVGTILLLIIVGLLYNSYRLKQRTNHKLELQQLEIAKQNLSLRHLVTEKDWLVKEIHHRVKNNLQIVMSLLNSQSAYIDNEPALTAIHDSQHRVHAMSLIHQKLYNSENVSSIDLSFYIRELVSYLADSFETGQRIRFEFDIEPMEMDVSQAVPLGLILNEAITNSIKYAFPGDRNGLISISLSNINPHQCLLIISDNGIGMPSQINNKKPGSLGMSLIAGLSEDLEGNLSIENNNGTTIKILFVHDLGIKRQDTSVTSFASNDNN